MDLIEENTDMLNAFEIKWGEKQPCMPKAFAENFPNVNYNVMNRINYLEFI